MTKRLILRAALFTTAALLAPLSASSASAAPWHGPVPAYNCTAGNVPPGTYGSMTISGVCYMPAGNIVVVGDLIIKPGALLDAVTPGDPTTGTPVVPATVSIGGNVYVGPGGVLLFGCSPNISCSSPPGISYDHINGNLIATGAQGVVVHSASIGGNVSLLGGGGGAAAETCNAQTPPPATLLTNLEPWSEDPGLYYTPVYSDFEDATVGGNLTVLGLTSCWLGTFRTQVGRNATFARNTMGDPDALEIDGNVVNGNFSCKANVPAVQFGDSGSAPNIVGRFASGECGFGVVLPNPAPEAMQGPPTFPAPTSEHIAVSKWGLRTYFGTETSTQVASLPSVVTSSGASIVADLDNFVLTGTGLTGSGTYNPSLPPGSSGLAYLATDYATGAVFFTDYGTCDPCSFDGQSGAVQFRAYGTSHDGFTSGTFLITSGGPFLSSAVPTIITTGGLATLAGYGTFFGSGGTVHVIEHLGFA